MNTNNSTARFFLKLAATFFQPRRIPPFPGVLSRILVVRQHDQLGDMLCVIPTLKALRKAHPGAEITLVASPVNYEIMKGHPALTRVLLFDKKAIRSSVNNLREFYRALRSEPCEVAIVPATVSISLTSGMIAWLSGAPVRIGPGRLEFRDNPSKFLFTHPVELDWSLTPARHQALRNADILQPMGIVPDDLTMNLGITPAELKYGLDLVGPLRAKHSPLIGIHPGAAKPGNRWPVESFIRLSEQLHETFSGGLVVTIGPQEGAIHDDLKSRLTVPHQFVRGESIRSIASVIAATDLFISNDTGPLHIAGALPVPVLGLFGPTDPVQWAPIGKDNHYLRSKDGMIGSIDPLEVFSLCEVILAGTRREMPRFD